MQIAIPLFPQVTALDAVGPYEVLQRLPGATVVFVGAATGEIRTDNGFLGLTVDATFAEVPRPDVVIVPGGVGTRLIAATASPDAGARDPLLDWLGSVHPTTRFTTSVCTGSMILAASGIAAGLRVATHWSTYEEIRALGAEPTGDRVVEHLDRRIITAAGVSSGIDMALRLAEVLVDADAARAMQLMIEYDPQPPFDSGSLEKASEAVVARVVEYAASKN